MGKLFLGLFIGLLVGLITGKLLFSTKANETISKEINTSSNLNQHTKNQYQNHKERNIPTLTQQEIPQKVYDVLKYIKQHHQAPEGYVGGREFKNRENQLPIYNPEHQKIKYQEWDVNPKMEGQNRGRERLVTGDDERNWYSSDHYKSFTQLKNQ